MHEPTEIPNIVYVKYEARDGGLQIARHMRPAILDPTVDLSDFVRDIVHSYKADPGITYLGLADHDEYEAFKNLRLPNLDSHDSQSNL
jgi:hypothetical protein